MRKDYLVNSERKKLKAQGLEEKHKIQELKQTPSLHNPLPNISIRKHK